MFSWQHIVWLIICVAAIFVSQVVYSRKRPSLDTVLTFALFISVLSELSKMVSVIELVPSTDGDLLLPYLPLNHLPLHFCSIQILLIFYVRFAEDRRKRESVLAFMYATTIIGGILALLMPSIFSTTVSPEEAFTTLVSYQFFIFHAMIISLGIIIVRSGEIKWRKEHFRDTLAIVYAFGFLSIYINSLFASPTYEDGELISVDFWTNFFFTYQNPLGIRLTKIWQWYLYLLIIIILAAVLLFLFFYPLVFRKKATRGQEGPERNQG